MPADQEIRKTMILPEGFTSRPTSRLINACAIQRTGQVQVGAAGLGSEWHPPGFCLETGTRLSHAPDGRLVVYALLWDRESHVLLRAGGAVQ